MFATVLSLHIRTVGTTKKQIITQKNAIQMESKIEKKARRAYETPECSCSFIYSESCIMQASPFGVTTEKYAIQNEDADWE